MRITGAKAVIHSVVPFHSPIEPLRHFRYIFPTVFHPSVRVILLFLGALLWTPASQAHGAEHVIALHLQRDIEIYFETDNAIIEFKAGRGKGLTRQVEDRLDPSVNPTRKAVIGVACDSSGISPHVAKGIEEKGGLSASGSQVDSVLAIIAP